MTRWSVLKSALVCAFLAVGCAAGQLGGNTNGIPGSAGDREVLALDLSVEPIPISRAIYGRNNSLSDTAGSPVGAAELRRLRDSGLGFTRENGGNNATKHNWRLKLASHPDWYNNVYAHDWDYEAGFLDAQLDGIQGMYAFQLIGWAAGSPAANFGDWAYNRSAWWSGVRQNLAGGGTVNAAGGERAVVNGDPSRYLTAWTPADTTGVLTHWFGSGGLGFDSGQFRYWSMDNEPEIWSSTHDDVMPVLCSGQDFVDRYVAVALAARASFPDIKLTGPVPANEWQWYDYQAWGGLGGLCWLEYFIREVAAASRTAGVRLIDVVDIHFYPETSDPDRILQLHRVFFDRGFVYWGANGVKEVNGGWDGSMNREYVLERCRDWLDEYGMIGVGVGITEIDVPTNDPNLLAVWYASCLGEFMANSGEIFAPWSWKPGMWEVMHLFTRYNRAYALAAVMTDDALVSAYPSIDPASGAMTVVMVNRSRTDVRHVVVDLGAPDFAAVACRTLTLSGLPAGETFASHGDNALAESAVSFIGGAAAIDLSPLSVKSIIIDQPVGRQ